MTDEAMDNIVKLASAAGKPALLTEDSAALEFTDKYRGKLLYDHDVGAWFRWTESHCSRNARDSPMHGRAIWCASSPKIRR